MLQMDVLKYYFDYFNFNFYTFPFVVRIAVSITFVFLTFVFCMLITLFLRKLISKQEIKINTDEKSKCYMLLEAIITFKDNVTYNVLEEKSSHFKKVCGNDSKRIIKVLLSIKKEFPNEFNFDNSRGICRLFDLGALWDENLSKGSLKEKIEALDEITGLNASISESTLSKLVYHKNSELRKRARIAQIHLSQHDPFRFFEEEFDQDFTKWDKIKIHNILLHRTVNTIPNFARWIPKIKNEDLQCLFIFEIGYFSQIENKNFVFELFRNTISDKVKVQCIKTLDVLGIQTYKEQLIKLYPICSEKVQLCIIDVLTPIKQEYYSKFRLLFMRLIFSLKLDAYPGSISLLG
jgi:hypothetical protein